MTLVEPAARARAFRPPAPIPPEGPLDPLSLLWRLWTNPLSTWGRQVFERSIVQSDGLLGHVAVVSDPTAIRRVLLDNGANYRKDPLQLRILAPGLGNGLLTAQGDEWRVQRRALAPLFTPRRIADFLPAMVESADRLLARWAPLREGRRIDVSAEMSRLTLDVLERTIFPQGLGRDPKEFADAVTGYFDSIGQLHPFDLLNAPRWLPRIGRRNVRPAMRFFGEAVDGIIAARRTWLSEHGDVSDAEQLRDLLTLLLSAVDPQTGQGLSEGEIRANILTFIGAGHETTANALSWSLFLLSAHPEWRAQVEAEVDDVLSGHPIGAECLDRLVKTRATIEEALRLYPPAASLSREAIAADVLGGQHVPAGTLVLISPWVVHRHRLLWEEPERFDPLRFMPGRRDTIDRYAYLPFGAGARVCIGMGFALQEATVLLASMLRQFRLDLAPGHAVMPVQRITLRPRGGMPMLITRRSQARDLDCAAV